MTQNHLINASMHQNLYYFLTGQAADRVTPVILVKFSILNPMEKWIFMLLKQQML